MPPEEVDRVAEEEEQGQEQNWNSAGVRASTRSKISWAFIIAGNSSILAINFNAERLIPTWATMSKIVRRLKGLSNWSDTEQVRRYQAERLGRLDGETFLTEILPFPAWNTRDWPANPWFETRAQYEKEVRPKRISMLRELHETYSPRYVFCYGTGNWAHHHDIFSDVSFEPILDGRVLLGRSRSSTIVLTPFFAYYLMTNDLIDGIARALEAPPCA